MAENFSNQMERMLTRFFEYTLQDIRVECAQEFDRNFEREAFFNEKWARRKYNDDETRGLLMRTGILRKSLIPDDFATITDHNSVVFETTVPYARIHNEGGEITVTRAMKQHFWGLYRKAMGSRTYRIDGTQRNDKKNRQMNSDAAFYRAMALKKIGSKIRIPKRQFIGNHPELQKTIRDIIVTNYKDIFNKQEP